jgi:hypothetical protein
VFEAPPRHPTPPSVREKTSFFFLFFSLQARREIGDEEGVTEKTKTEGLEG